MGQEFWMTFLQSLFTAALNGGIMYWVTKDYKLSYAVFILIFVLWRPM